MNFVAIDFETANEKINSVCQIGIVTVVDNKVVDKVSWLVKPPEFYFNSFNTLIHGIKAEDVINEPEFNELWPEINKYLEGKLVIAHNASFDIGVLRSVLDFYNIKHPKLDYCCSVKIAKKVWTDLQKHGLKAMSQHLAIDFTHHDAAEDAFASAVIVIEAAKIEKVKSMKALLDKLEIHPGKVAPEKFLPIRQLNEFNLNKVHPSKLDKKHPFYSQTVVFTGTLKSTPRGVAMQMVANAGGICSASVNQWTDFLVVGEQQYKRYKEGWKSSKLKKAESLIEVGESMQFLSEEEFFELLGEK